jgi:hypothetical protein
MFQSRRISYSHLLHSFPASVVLVALLAGCTASAPPRSTSQVVVAPVGASGSTSATEMTRAELEAHVRRYADRYITRVAIASNAVIAGTSTVEQSRFMEDWKNISYTAIVEVAIGPDAMTNLLDMMTLAMLSRLVVEEYWSPDVLTPAVGDEIAAGFLQAYVDLEEDIWTVADDVLTAEQQSALRVLIREWREENPEQTYPWYVRLSNFSGQRAASLEAVKQSGGMLQEVARAREAAEEIQAFGERVLFYLQRAPMLTSGQFESSAADILGGPEISLLVEDIDRFVVAVERLVAVIEELPGGRLHAVDQFMDRLAEERVATLTGMANAGPEIQKLLAELLPVMQSFERAMVAINTDDPGAEPFDIGEYRALIAESATTAAELRLLTQSLTEVMNSDSQMNTLVESLVEIEESIINKLFNQMLLLLAIFFAGLVGYRYISTRFFPN